MSTAEFQLVVRCCRLAFDPSFAVSSDHQDLDWQRFYRLVRFHRVQGLVWKSVGALGGAAPAEVLRAIAQDAASIAATNRLSLTECRDLAAALESRGIDFLFVKGLPLGVLAYGTPWPKAAVDVDLLVDEKRLDAAVQVLRDCGYRREDGKPEAISAVCAWHRLRKDSEWGKPNSMARVDLHSRLTDNRALIPTVGLHSPRQLVEIADGVRLPTLASDQLVAHLCVHGASSAWFRLKWITDFAALLNRHPPDELTRLYLRSVELGAGRAAGQAFLLADELYGLLKEAPGLKRNIEKDSATRWLMSAAVKQLSAQSEPVEPTSRLLGTLRIHLTQFALLPGPAFKISELVRQTRAALA